MKASICPPIESMASAISRALRLVGALEDQVLDEVRDAVERRRLVAAAVAQPDADR